MVTLQTQNFGVATDRVTRVILDLPECEELFKHKKIKNKKNKKQEKNNEKKYDTKNKK